MTERVMKAVDIFLDAINEGTLAKGSCTACAVGNLVARGLGGKVKILSINGHKFSTCIDENRNHVENREWASAFRTYNGKQSVEDVYLNNREVINNIEATDFTAKELMQIEYAFETNTKIEFSSYHLFYPKQIRADQINGLEAVVKVMLTFEEGVPATDEVVKEIFTDKANLIPIK